MKMACNCEVRSTPSMGSFSPYPVITIKFCPLHENAGALLKMVKETNHALYVVGKPKAVKEAMAGSKELIMKAEGRA